MVNAAMIEKWEEELQKVEARIEGWFERSEPRERAKAYVRGLLSEVKRKNGWQIAEEIGETTPDGTQRLLNQARWDENQVRDEMQRYLMEYLGDDQGILVIDETGFLKKGNHSAGVQRQYSGTAGRVENCQIGVFLSYSSPQGQALLDCALYLPQSWLADAPRCRQAQIPPQIPFATKPQLAQQMLAHAWANGVASQWVVADSIYGGDRSLRLWLEGQARWFVLEVPKNEALWSGFEQKRADEHSQSLTEEDWHRLSCGDGAKGPRLYDWAFVPLPRWQQDPQVMHGLLVRRSLEDQSLAYFVVFAPAQTALQTLVHVAGSRWTIEICFEWAKQEVGLADYEVRLWHAWYRHMTLAMLALATLVVLRATLPPTEKNLSPHSLPSLFLKSAV
jgi:SRSO17 transposase